MTVMAVLASVKAATAEALPEVIRGLRKQGFRFAEPDERSTFIRQFFKP